MSPEEFVAQLEQENGQLLQSLAHRAATAEPHAALSVSQLLQVALRNELEAVELAALWIPSETALDAKLAFARQCGDEARHFHLISERLRALGVEPADVQSTPPSPLLGYLGGLRSTVERAAAGPFTREAIAVARNEVFASFCAERGDSATAELYRLQIQPDEQHHHQLGRRLLLRYATTREAQTQAREAARTTLRIAEEVQELALLRRGLACLPGC